MSVVTGIQESLSFAYAKSDFVFATSILLLPKSEISSLKPSPVSLCRTWSETLNSGFVLMRHILGACFVSSVIEIHSTKFRRQSDKVIPIGNCISLHKNEKVKCKAMLVPQTNMMAHIQGTKRKQKPFEQ